MVLIKFAKARGLAEGFLRLGGSYLPSFVTGSVIPSGYTIAGGM